MASHSKTFTVHDWQGKGDAFRRALLAFGYQELSQASYRRPRILLVDHDFGNGGKGERPLVTRSARQGAAVFLYPHAAMACTIWDMGYPISPLVRAHFAPSEGYAEVLRRTEYPHPAPVVGWSLCDLRSFSPVKAVHKVLFGPMHPNRRGALYDGDRRLNALVFDRLLALVDLHGIQLTVRYLGTLEQNGLREEPGVRYVQGQPDLTIAEIDEADAVVGHNTFAYLAVARGKPVVMMAEHLPPRGGNPPGKIWWAQNWELYRDRLRFPLNLPDGDAWELLCQAAAGSREVEEWRRRHIGQPFDGSHFVAELERLL